MLNVRLLIADPVFIPHRYKSNGGGERDRTDDILLAKQALSQLSYTPIYAAHRCTT